MNIFVSYASEWRDLADRLRLALEAEGHDVFFDRSDLAAGESFHAPLREAVGAADVMVFLVSPESVAQGSYALTELGFAQLRWPQPAGHVLPVIAAPVPVSALPPYLKAVTLLQPQGDLVAETVAAVAGLRRAGAGRRRMLAWAVGGLVLAAGLGGAFTWRQAQLREQAAAQAAELAAQARRDALVRQVTTAAQLCDTGGHALAWTRFEALVAEHPQDRAVLAAREDCAMHWTRNMRAAGEKQTFAEQVAKVQPVLAQGLDMATAQRAGDLHAHIGWGEFLRWRDGQSEADPVAHYRRAVAADADNPYGHAMWAHRIAWMHGAEADMRSHFDAALRTPRARAYVRSMQFAVARNRYALMGYAVGVLDAMRRAGESPTDEQRQSLWGEWCERGLQSPDYRGGVLAEVAPADALATYRWLWALERTAADRRPAWRLCEGVLLAHAGDKPAARSVLRGLLGELGVQRDQWRAGREAAAVLAGLGT